MNRRVPTEMRPEILIIQKLPDAVKAGRWGVSATMSLGFTPLHFLIGDLYRRYDQSPDQEVGDLRELYDKTAAEGVVYLDYLAPPLILVKQTKNPDEITKLARQLVRVADENRLEDLVLDHYRMLGFSRFVNPALALPMLRGIKTTPTVSLQRIHIFADQSWPHEGKNHAWDWRDLLQRSLL